MSRRKAKQALKKVIQESMRLKHGDSLLLILDTRTWSLNRLVCDTAHELGLDFAILIYPVHCQKAFQPPFSALNKRMFEDAQGILTLLTEAPACTRFRLALLTAALSAECKVVHMPGVDLEVLSASNDIPYQRVDELSCQYSKILSDGKSVEIITIDSNDKTHKLSFSIEGRQGHADGGIVEAGEIINLPNGEAYIAPMEGTAIGSVVINGSVPDGVLKKQDIILHFEDGKLIQSKTCGKAQAQIERLLKSLEVTSKLDGGNSYLLGEFGIGCNPGYTQLTGRQIVDEKIAGTVHIALGANIILGGTIESDTHLDLVFWPIYVFIDDQAVILPDGG